MRARALLVLAATLAARRARASGAPRLLALFEVAPSASLRASEAFRPERCLVSILDGRRELSVVGTHIAELNVVAFESSGPEERRARALRLRCECVEVEPDRLPVAFAMRDATNAFLIGEAGTFHLYPAPSDACAAAKSLAAAAPGADARPGAAAGAAARLLAAALIAACGGAAAVALGRRGRAAEAGGGGARAAEGGAKARARVVGDGEEDSDDGLAGEEQRLRGGAAELRQLMSAEGSGEELVRRLVAELDGLSKG